MLVPKKREQIRKKRYCNEHLLKQNHKINLVLNTGYEAKITHKDPTKLKVWYVLFHRTMFLLNSPNYQGNPEGLKD